MRLIFTWLLVTVALIQPGAAEAVREPVPTADEMRVFLTKRPEMDEIRWKDRDRGSLQVRILRVNETEVDLEKTVQNRVASHKLPLADLAGVSFVFAPLEQRLIRNPSAEAEPALRVVWEARKATLGMETSNVAHVGLALAKALRMRGDAAAFEEAESILDLLRDKEPSSHRLEAARHEMETLQLARAMASSSPEEIDEAAWKMTERDENTEGMLLATAWLAGRHFEDLKRLDEEHPRWDEDEEVRPLRLRLYNLSLDFALYPSLFHGTREKEASEGLKQAWRVYQYSKSPQLALYALEDLAALYPDSQAAVDTADELARVRQREAAGQLEDEEAAEEHSSEEGEADDGEEPQGVPKTPRQPRRYNLFDD